jgi:hypothetical protein
MVMTESSQNPLTEDKDQQSKSMKGQHSKVRKGNSGNVEFKGIEPSDLGSVPVVVQALDNQWMPHSLLYEALERGKITASIGKKLKKQVRAEYIRSLINGDQVVVNRAFLYNNQNVAEDYRRKGPKREAFKALLDSGVIVPYLYKEKTPDVEPAFGVTKDFRAWQQLCQEVRLHCVRFSWDDQLNDDIAKAGLSGRFHDFAETARNRDIGKYLEDLGLDSSAENTLKKRLGELKLVCANFMEDKDSHVTRDHLYKAFVTAGDNTSERRYDRTKDLSGEIKQLLDLAYNGYLADGLGGYLLTPIDSLHRTALQEWQTAASQPNQVTSNEIMQLLQRSAFSLVQEGLYLKSMSLLSLLDVLEVRHMNEWEAYIRSMEDLLLNPLQFAEGGAASIYKNYIKLAERMTNLVVQRNEERRAELTAQWTPVVELVIDIAGAILSVIGTSEGLPVYKFMGDVSSHVAAKAAPVVARLVIRSPSKVDTQADLITSIDFMKWKMRDARGQWADIQRQVKELPGFKEWKVSSEKASDAKAPNRNYQEQEVS